jgi:hypothetical protein
MTDTIRDARETFHFWVDDAVIDQFATSLGPYGLALYTVLCRRAKKGQSYPSIKKLAADTGMGATSVKKYLGTLRDLGLITITPRKDEWGDPTSNLYTILDLSHLSNRGSVPGDPPRSPDDRPQSPDDPGVGRQTTDPRSPDDHEVVPLEGAEILRSNYLCTEPESVQALCPTIDCSHEELPRSKEKKAARKRPQIAPISDDDWPGLREMIAQFNLPIHYLDDNNWWNGMSYVCNNPTPEWLEREFARMEMWCVENASKTPTTQWKKFVRRWLENAYENERKKRASAQIHPYRRP